MSDETELADVVERVIELSADMKDVSPAWIATQAMTVIEFPRSLHRLGYAGCHLELRQIARGKLRRRFDPTIGVDDDIEVDDLFPETLQERYPKAKKRGEEPTYRKLDALGEEDVAYNVGRMRAGAGALLRHADRLEEWWDAKARSA